MVLQSYTGLLHFLGWMRLKSTHGLKVSCISFSVKCLFLSIAILLFLPHQYLEVLYISEIYTLIVINIKLYIFRFAFYLCLPWLLSSKIIFTSMQLTFSTPIHNSESISWLQQNHYLWGLYILLETLNTLQTEHNVFNQGSHATYREKCNFWTRGKERDSTEDECSICQKDLLTSLQNYFLKISPCFLQTHFYHYSLYI